MCLPSFCTLPQRGGGGVVLAVSLGWALPPGLGGGGSVHCHCGVTGLLPLPSSPRPPIPIPSSLDLQPQSCSVLVWGESQAIWVEKARGDLPMDTLPGRTHATGGGRRPRRTMTGKTMAATVDLRIQSTARQSICTRVKRWIRRRGTCRRKAWSGWCLAGIRKSLQRSQNW